MHLEHKLVKRKEAGNLRQLKVLPPLIDFSSNDYLGLAKSPVLYQAVLQECSPHNGLGSTGSRLLTGNSAYVEALEERIAEFHGYETGVLFNCGYMANVGLLSTLGSKDTVIFFDAAIHASSHDGIRLSRAKAFPFQHNCLDHLEKRLKQKTTEKDCFICVESVYSTDGSIAPLTEICSLAEHYNAHVIVDEAHAVGVYGPNGRGLVVAHNLTEKVFATVVTFGKALGTFGAIVLGSPLLKQLLINFATSYIYTTALPFPALAAIKCSYDLFPELEKERQHLNRLVHLFQEFYPHGSSSHIQSIPIKGNVAVKQAAQHLMHAGFDVRPLLSPTVQRGHEMLRVCLHAFNTEEEVIRLCTTSW